MAQKISLQLASTHYVYVCIFKRPRCVKRMETYACYIGIRTQAGHLGRPLLGSHAEKERRRGAPSEGANIDEVEKMLKAIRLVIRSAISSRGQKFIVPSIKKKEEASVRRSKILSLMHYDITSPCCHVSLPGRS